MDKKIIRIAKYLANNGFYKDAARIIKLAGVKIHNSQYWDLGDEFVDEFGDEFGDGMGGKIFEFANNDGQSFFYNVTTNVLADSLKVARNPDLISAGEEASLGEIILGSQRKELLKILVSQLKGQDYRDVLRRMEEEPASYFPVTRFQYGKREYELPDDHQYVRKPQFSTPSLTINGNILKYVESEMDLPEYPGISAINDYNSFTLDLQSGRYQSNEISLDVALEILVNDGRVTSGLGGRIARAVMLNRKPYWWKKFKAAEKSGDDEAMMSAAELMIYGIPDDWLPANWKEDPVEAFYLFR